MFSPRVYNSKRFESVSKRITTRDVGSGSPYLTNRSNNNEEEKGTFALSPLDSYVWGLIPEVWKHLRLHEAATMMTKLKRKNCIFKEPSEGMHISWEKLRMFVELGECVRTRRQRSRVCFKYSGNQYRIAEYCRIRAYLKNRNNNKEELRGRFGDSLIFLWLLIWYIFSSF